MFLIIAFLSRNKLKDKLKSFESSNDPTELDSNQNTDSLTFRFTKL